MTWIDAFLLGIVQGLAEFLPISSSGHLEICSKILGLNLGGAEALDFDATLHVATALSTIMILRKEFTDLCSSFFTLKNDKNTRLVLKILLSALPVAVVGLFFKDAIESFFGGKLLTVGICLVITSLLLILAWRFGADSSRTISTGSKARKGHNITWLDAFIIGCSQAVAVLPGLSRSGTTIATGLLLGDKREQVARFSFLMVLVPILGEALLDIVKFFGHHDGGNSSVGIVPLIVGFLTAFIVGCAACKWMLEVVRKGRLAYFAVYCLIVGAICILW